MCAHYLTKPTQKNAMEVYLAIIIQKSLTLPYLAITSDYLGLCLRYMD
jgi:hypothetical protein